MVGSGDMMTVALASCQEPFSRRAPIEDDWTFHRPLITELYIDRNLTLLQVQRLMREYHHFEAT